MGSRRAEAGAHPGLCLFQCKHDRGACRVSFKPRPFDTAKWIRLESSPRRTVFTVAGRAFTGRDLTEALQDALPDFTADDAWVAARALTALLQPSNERPLRQPRLIPKND